ncbi:MAG: hypothetical protein L3J71_12430 [Victivallaceae bacterium]|nr:hypothetical protein [Victivallaceae bacterium]
MKINWKYSFIIVILTACVLPVKAAHIKSYTLKNGRVLIAPHIVGRKPNGLEVSHSEGVSFIPFTQMQKKTQERFNYSPKKAAAFTKREIASKKRRTIREKQEKQALAKRREQYAERKVAYNYEQLGDDIYKLKERINFLQAEIPKLESNQDKYMNTAVNMSSQAADNNSGGGGGGRYGNFFGGYSSGSNSSRAERTKRRSIRNVADEYAEGKSDLKRYQSELEMNILSLRKLEQEYKKQGGDVNKIEGSSGAKGDKSFMSTVTNLFK